jgi:ABC-type nitrate/sulfonate/bicarbonate transport system substrate-binding protein
MTMKTMAGRLLLVVAVLMLYSTLALAQPLQKITINFPTRSGASWPLFMAKEGGYYQKYGLDVDLVFAGHPGGIAMGNSAAAGS